MDKKGSLVSSALFIALFTAVSYVIVQYFEKPYGNPSFFLLSLALLVVCVFLYTLLDHRLETSLFSLFFGLIMSAIVVAIIYVYQISMRVNSYPDVAAWIIFSGISAVVCFVFGLSFLLSFRLGKKKEVIQLPSEVPENPSGKYLEELHTMYQQTFPKKTEDDDNETKKGRFCKGCGARLDNDDMFCPGCGAKSL